MPKATLSVNVIIADLNEMNHRESIVNLLNCYIADPMGGGALLSPLKAEIVLEGLRSHPTSEVFIAYLGKKSIGMAVCFWGFSTFDAAPLLNIHDLIVDNDFRGQGVGATLLSKVEERAKNKGAGRITLEVRDDNLKAKCLYDKFNIKSLENPMEFRMKKL